KAVPSAPPAPAASTARARRTAAAAPAAPAPIAARPSRRASSSSANVSAPARVGRTPRKPAPVRAGEGAKGSLPAPPVTTRKSPRKATLPPVAPRAMRPRAALPRRPRALTAVGSQALVRDETLATLMPTLSEEETIESSKYVPARPARLFEEERFIFPQSYGVNRARLLVKDPDWLFAYWDVYPRTLDELRASLGERVVALSRI